MESVVAAVAEMTATADNNKSLRRFNIFENEVDKNVDFFECKITAMEKILKYLKIGKESTAPYVAVSIF